MLGMQGAPQHVVSAHQRRMKTHVHFQYNEKEVARLGLTVVYQVCNCMPANPFILWLPQHDHSRRASPSSASAECKPLSTEVWTGSGRGIYQDVGAGRVKEENLSSNWAMTWVPLISGLVFPRG